MYNTSYTQQQVLWLREKSYQNNRDFKGVLKNIAVKERPKKATYILKRLIMESLESVCLEVGDTRVISQILGATTFFDVM